MRQFYTPRLLSRLLQFETLPPIASISELSRLLPEVSIVDIVPKPNELDKVEVTVSLKSTKAVASTETSGVYDLRLREDVSWSASLPSDESFSAEKSQDLSNGIAGKRFEKQSLFGCLTTIPVQ